jgi:hypothetical protein
MKRFLAQIRLILAAWAFLRRWHRLAHGSWPVPPQAESEWTDEAAHGLRAYLKTPTGAALLLKLREADLRTTAHAVHIEQAGSREWRCGDAAGFRASAAYLITLSTPPAALAGLEPDAEGADALLARLAP